MEILLKDVRFAVRVLGRRPGFSVSAVLVLALGMGASTAIFSVLNGVLLQPLPYPDPERIVMVWQVYSKRGNHMQTSDPNFQQWRDWNRTLQSISQWGSGVLSVVGGSEPVRARVAAVSRGFFDVMGVAPARGRAFVPEEMQPGARPVAVVSYGLWSRLLEADPDFQQRTLRFSNRSHTVVGVMPPGFNYPTGAEIWIPRELQPVNPFRTAHNWFAVARIKEGVTLEQARQDMHEVARRQIESAGEEIWLGDVDLVPLHEELVGDVKPRLLILLGAVGFLLLVAGTNVSNLLLAHSATQRRELSMRAALGASRTRLIRQHLTETGVLTLAGGVFGVALAYWGVPVLLSLEPGNLPRVEEISLNWTVLAFTLFLAALVALVLGLLPAFHLSGRSPAEFLKQGGRTHTGATGARTRGVLVVAQVAFTLVLLAGAGLLARSFERLLDVDPGFRTEKIVTMRLTRSRPQSDAERDALRRFNDELMQRLAALPGVTEVGGISALPFSRRYSNGRFLVDNREDDPGYAEFRVATAGYFRVMGIPLLQGRLPEPSDMPESNHVCVISRSLAEEKWPHQEAIGKRIQFGNMDGDRRLLHVVGIVGDIQERGLGEQPRPTVYLNARQRPQRTSDFTLAVQISGAVEPIVSEARRIVRSLDPELPMRFQTMEEIFSSSVADRRFTLMLLGLFSAAALGLAGIGLFSVLACFVNQRTVEIAVRMALGAEPGKVLRLVLARGLLLAGAGLVLGTPAALALAPLLSSVLFAVSPFDPVTFSAVAALLLGVAAAACALPALRAVRVEPMAALRRE